MLAHTAPHYSCVLTGWAPRPLDGSAGVVLSRTDQLILCCGTTGFFLHEAARALRAVRDAGHARLAREVVVVVTNASGPARRRPPAALGGLLGLGPSHVVQVPFDAALRGAGS